MGFFDRKQPEVPVKPEISEQDKLIEELREKLRVSEDRCRVLDQQNQAYVALDARDKERMAELQEKCDKLSAGGTVSQDEYNSLKSRLDDFEREKASSLKEIEELRAANERYQATILQLSKTITDTKALIKHVRERQAELDEENKRLKTQSKNSQTQGTVDSADVEHLETLKQANTRLNDTIAELQSSLSTTSDELSELKVENVQQQTEITSLKNEISSLTISCSAKQDKIDSLTHDVEVITDKRASLEQELKSVKEQCESLERELVRLQSAQGTVEQQLQAAQEEKASLEKEIADERKKRQQTETEVSQLREHSENLEQFVTGVKSLIELLD